MTEDTTVRKYSPKQSWYHADETKKDRIDEAQVTSGTRFQLPKDKRSRGPSASDARILMGA